MLVLLVEHFFTEEGRARFPAWVREIGEAASRFAGFVDIRQMTRLDAPERCFFMLSFATPEHARRWIDSPQRQELLARMGPYRLKEQEGTRWIAGEAWAPPATRRREREEIAMALPVTGIGHIALRVTDLPRSARFYTEAVGFTLLRQNERVCFVEIGGVVIVLIAGTDQTAPDDRFDPFRVGLDHLALTVPAAELPALKARLDAAGVRNNGVEHDERSGAESITFYDPDDIAWEFYASAR